MPTAQSFVKLTMINSAASVCTLFTQGNLIVVSQVGLSMNTPTPLEGEAASWRQRAEDARREADLTTDPIARDTLIGIAEAYEKLAAIAGAKLASKRERSS